MTRATKKINGQGEVKLALEGLEWVTSTALSGGA